MSAAKKEAAPAVRYTADHVRAALHGHFAGNGSVILEEVGESTGARANPRWIDMLVMETWPSRGFCIHGIEIKVSRADWQKELATPAKAEQLHRHCDRWWVATANKGVILSTDELPPGWGWMEIRPDQEKRPVVVVHQARAEQRPPELDRRFVAAMLRAHQRKQSREDGSWMDREVTRRVEERLKDHERTVREDGTRAERLAKKLIEAFGSSLGWLEADSTIKALRLVRDLGLHQNYTALSRALDALEAASKASEKIGETAAEIRAALEAELKTVGLAPPEKTKRGGLFA